MESAPDEVVEYLVDVLGRLGRGLKELAMEALVGEGLGLLGSDGALINQVALVADENHGNVFSVLHLDDLIADSCGRKRVSDKEYEA